MSRSTSLTALAVVFSLAACAPAAPPAEAPADPAALKTTIQAREKEWSAAYLAGNAAAIAALYTEDGAQIQAAAEAVKGRDAITKAEQAQFDTVAATTREDITDEVIPAGNYITEIGHYSFAGTHKKTKKAISGSGRYMVLWHKDADGAWRLHRDIGNDAPAKKP